MDVDELIREFWEADYETDPRTAAKHLLAMIPPAEREATLLTLLAYRYSSFLSREGPQKKIRRSSSQNPAARGRAVERGLDMRPFFVPSRKSGLDSGYVYFKDMTPEYWLEWIEHRQRKAEKLLTGIAWAKNVLDMMGQHGVTTAGDLPVPVKEQIFSRGVPDE